jgi:predicted nuclease with TOPRIM domain
MSDDRPGKLRAHFERRKLHYQTLIGAMDDAIETTKKQEDSASKSFRSMVILTIRSTLRDLETDATCIETLAVGAYESEQWLNEFRANVVNDLKRIVVEIDGLKGERSELEELRQQLEAMDNAVKDRIKKVEPVLEFLETALNKYEKSTQDDEKVLKELRYIA